MLSGLVDSESRILPLNEGCGFWTGTMLKELSRLKVQQIDSPRSYKRHSLRLLTIYSVSCYCFRKQSGIIKKQQEGI